MLHCLQPYSFRIFFFFSSRRRHTRFDCDWSSDLCSSDLDHWTVHPQVIEAVKAAALKDSALDTIRTARTRDGRVPAKYFGLLHDPAQRDPRGYILPSDQADFPTATKFVNTLIKNGVTVLRAAGDFDVAGRHYPAQSHIVPAAQAFPPHALDMFEPQDHPNDFQFPGGPPIPPYDKPGRDPALS